MVERPYFNPLSHTHIHYIALPPRIYPKVLKLDPDNVKAHFRRAVAYRAQDDFDKAKHHIMLAVEKDPKNVAVRKEYDNLRTQIAAYKRGTREVRHRIRPL